MTGLLRKSSCVLLSAILLFDLLPAQVVWAQDKQEKKDMLVAIVDFTNMRNEPALEYLVKTIPEQITTYLGSKGRVRIVERARLQAALEEIRLAQAGIVEEQRAVEVGKALGADAVIVGSFVQIGDKIRINARLIDVKTSEIIVAAKVDGKPGTELFDLMDQTAASMEVKLIGEGGQILSIQQVPGLAKQQKKHGKTWLLLGVLGAGAAGGAAFALKPKQAAETKGTIPITVDLP